MINISAKYGEHTMPETGYLHTYSALNSNDMFSVYIDDICLLSWKVSSISWFNITCTPLIAKGTVFKIEGTSTQWSMYAIIP